MANELTAGQQAAARAAKTRRAELGLTQKELAKKAGVHHRTIQDFERKRIWPQGPTLAKIERLGLKWHVGYLQEYADRHASVQQPSAWGEWTEATTAPSPVEDDVQRILSIQSLPAERKLELIQELYARSAKASGGESTAPEEKMTDEEMADLLRRAEEGGTARQHRHGS